MTSQQVATLRAIAKMIIEAVSEADKSIGAPAGHLYAAMMAAGCSLNQFEQIMSGLVRGNMLTKSGDCYFATEKGLTFIK